ncbi:MAG: tetratricopeptide repeat protein [Phycisphaera sp.]|nr:tetratricopeptide repeat protein [Phycisphaera sp.]
MTLGRLIIVMIVLGAGYWVWMNSSEEEKAVVTRAVDTPDMDPLTKANTHFGLGQYAQALPLYEKVLQDSPQHTDKEHIMYNLAMCYEKVREFGKAADHYMAYIKAYPKGKFIDEAKEKYDRNNGLR